MIKNFEPYFDSEPAGVILPKIILTKEELSEISSELNSNSTSSEVLRALARKGIHEKGILNLPNKKDYLDRAKQEIETFEELGFVDYVLLNWDVLGYCHKNNIIVGNGRGSAGGSLILYLLGVTNVDPIEHNLFFERFVSKSRSQKAYGSDGTEYLIGSLLPDVDSDISYDQRKKVIEYIESKHFGKTSKILTFNTYSSKLCIKEVCKYFCKYSEIEAQAISDLIPKAHGRVLSLDEAVEESEKFREWSEENNEAFLEAKKIEDKNKNFGVHPSGLAISSLPIRDLIPLQSTKDGDIVSGYDMNDVADLMVKFDILGLRTLSVVARTCEKLGISIDEVPHEDSIIYQQLQNLETPYGLFQISADTNYQVCRDVKPRNLQELSDVIALARPATLQFVSEYINQKQNPRRLGLHDELDKILESSKNVMIYQESMMQACHRVFGMTLEEAESLRRAIGKKKLEEIPAWKSKIFESASLQGISQEAAEYFWNVVEAAGNYAFNKSHSAAYAILAAKTVYLKFKHPKEFFCSVLELSEFEPDPQLTISSVAKEMPHFGLKLLRPCLIKSKISFSIEGDGIRYGLNNIKGISEKTIEALLEFRDKQKSSKLAVFMAAKESGLNISALASLIQAGTLSDDKLGRPRQVLEAYCFNQLTPREQRNFIKVSDRFDDNLLKAIAECVEKGVVADDGKPIMKQSRFETFKNKVSSYVDIYKSNSKHDKFCNWWYETKLLGYSFSERLKDCFEERFAGLLDLQQVKELPQDSPFKCVGVVTDVFTRTSRNGNKYMMLKIADDFAEFEFLAMDNRRASTLTRIEDQGLPKKEDVIFIKARKSDSRAFIEDLTKIEKTIYMKTSQFKK